MMKSIYFIPILILSFAASLGAATDGEAIKSEEFSQYTQQTYLPLTKLSSNRFGFSDENGENTLTITGRIQVDTGDYVRYRPDEGTNARHLVSGINVLAAYFGIVGKFGGVWHYSLEYNFGGSSDSLNINNASASANVLSTPTYTNHGHYSGIYTAFISYTGWYDNCKFPVALDFGIMHVPWTLGQAIDSNDSIFIQPPSPETVAIAFGGGDTRSAFVVRSNNDRYWIGAMLTGPKVGAFHVTSPPPPTAPTGCRLAELSFLGRASYQLVRTESYSVHMGVNGAYLFHPRGGINNSVVVLSDRPELTVDPTKFLNTQIIPISSGGVIGTEGVITIGNLLIQGEYYLYVVNQIPPTNPHPTLHLHGGYIEGSYTFGGRRHYLPILGSHTGVIINRSHSEKHSFWKRGAIELALRYDLTDLNSHVIEGVPTAATGGLRGGKQSCFGAGINFYPNDYIRFTLDYEMVHVEKIDDLNGITPIGASINWLALRTQVHW